MGTKRNPVVHASWAVQRVLGWMSQSQRVHLAASPRGSGRRRWRAYRLGERQEQTKQGNWGKVPRKEDLVGRQTSLQAGAMAYGHRDFRSSPPAPSTAQNRCDICF